MQKATPVPPPTTPRSNIIEVDMTRTYGYIASLGFSVAMTSIVTFSLWRKVRVLEERGEAMRDFVAKLINTTECGELAYQRLLDEFEPEEDADEADDDLPVNWDEDDDEEEEFKPPVIRRRARDIIPNV
jgi:hypothetical protein